MKDSFLLSTQQSLQYYEVYSVEKHRRFFFSLRRLQTYRSFNLNGQTLKEVWSEMSPNRVINDECDLNSKKM